MVNRLQVNDCCALPLGWHYTLSLVPELSDEELDALVEEATVDAYGDDEQLGGFAVMIEDNLEVPRCAARPYTGRLRVALGEASRTQGWLGLVRRCAVSETWWRRMA